MTVNSDSLTVYIRALPKEFYSRRLIVQVRAAQLEIGSAFKSLSSTYRAAIANLSNGLGSAVFDEGNYRRCFGTSSNVSMAFDQPCSMRHG